MSGGAHQNSYMQDLTQCLEHPLELITNFCSCLECLKPLCPECVTIHNQQHKQQRTYAEIETIRNVKQRCETKLLSAANLLEQQIMNCERALLLPEGSLDENVQILRRYRKRIDEVIDTHFKNIEEQIVHNMKELQTRITHFQPTFDKMKQIIGEFQGLSYDLSSKDYVDIVQKVCQMDVQHIVAKFKGEINRVASSLSQECLLPKLDDARLFYLVEELERVVSIRQADVQDQLQISQFGQTGSQKSPQKINKQSSQSYEVNQQAQQQQQYKQLKQNYQNSTGSMNNMSIQEDGLKQTNQINPQQYIQQQFNSNELFQIATSDYFDKKAPRKFLHFFQNDDNKLHYLDLYELDTFEQKENKYNANNSNANQFNRKVGAASIEKYNIISIDLKIPFRIPSFHKSIAIPNGELYLTGGTIPDGQMNKSGQIYQYDWQNQSLIQLGNMNHPRSSHGIAYLSGKIYVVGGYEHKHVMTKRCERFNIQNKKWEMISNLNYAATSLSLCSFNGKYLFKFGGIGEGYDNHLLSPYIERYDQQADCWEVIDPKLSHVHRLNKVGFNFGLLSTSAAVQINKNEIFIFGGYHEDNSGSNQSFILQVLDDEELQQDEEEKEYENQQNNQYEYQQYQQQNQQFKNIQQSKYFIKSINTKLLPNSEAFWNNVPIIFNKKIYALQNIAGENSDNCLENERKILVFNERDWKALN